MSSERQSNVMTSCASSSPDQDSILYSLPGPGRLVVRRFDAKRDSWERLTTLLHRAVAPLASGGLHCEWADQDASATRQRARIGECFVSVCSGQVIGTMTLTPHDPDSPCEHYRRNGVATLQQFAVSRSWQGKGVGRAMLAFAGRWAVARGAHQLALDVPFPANALIDFYRTQGFTLIDVVHFPGRGYESAVFSRPAFAGWPAFPLTRRRAGSRVRR
jgi:GNAT superfamily N-acetyltransferase